MQYGELIARSFSIVWRHKYLWLLAILGGADVTSGGSGVNFSGIGNTFNGGGSSSNGGGTASAGSPASFQDAIVAAGRYAQDHLGLLVTLGVVVLLIVVAWWLLSCVTTGALVRAAAEHDAERPFAPGIAWRTGLGTFWSILGLRLVALLWAVVVIGVIGGMVAYGIVSYLGGQTGAVALAIGVGILVVAVLVLASIPVGIALILGTRAAVLEQRGPLSALGRGFQLLGGRLGRVLLVWLLQVGLGLAAGLGLGIVFIPVLIGEAAVVIGAVVAGGAFAAVVLAVVATLDVVLGLILGGIIGAYLSVYWTLAFRRMEIEAPRPVAWPQAPYGAR